MVNKIEDSYPDGTCAADYADSLPKEVRRLIREEKITGETSGMCSEYAQANLVVLPKDIPQYCIYENGELTGRYTDVSSFWKEDLVSFLIGCSFSFEGELLKADIPVRQIEEHCNVPMYRTNIACKSAGVFHGNMVVSMRPIPYALVPKAVQVTGSMPKVHGAPVHIGDPKVIGIHDLERPDFGDAVTIREGEVPVFWPCGVTPQAVVMASKPSFCITHAPGHMLVTDVKNINLKY